MKRFAREERGNTERPALNLPSFNRQVNFIAAFIPRDDVELRADGFI